MNEGGAGGAFAALFFAIGVLLLFAIGFAFFLVVPFFVFLAGIIAMIISDRKRDSDRPADQTSAPEEPRQGEPA